MKGRRPDYKVSTVTQGESGDRWRDIGVAFTSEKGNIMVLLDALPVSAKLILSVPQERPQQPAAEARPMEARPIEDRRMPSRAANPR